MRPNAREGLGRVGGAMRSLAEALSGPRTYGFVTYDFGKAHGLNLKMPGYDILQPSLAETQVLAFRARLLGRGISVRTWLIARMHLMRVTGLC